MGLVLATARRSLRNRQDESDSNRNQANPNASGGGNGSGSDHLTNPNNNNEPLGSHANSRLNIINQLISFSSGGGRKSKSNNNANLNDFQNISFNSHFFLAGRKFKNLINQAQTFLFGDQLDLAFVLSHKPVVFPYDTSPLDIPSNYLQSLVNIRKDTLRLVKCVESNFYESAPALNSSNDVMLPASFSQQQQLKYNIEFVFDCDCDVQIRIHYFANERFTEVSQKSGNKFVLNYSCNCARFTNCVSSNAINTANQQAQSKCICLKSDSNPIIYKKGCNLLFKQAKHFIMPSKFPSSAWQFNIHSNYYPIVIECIPCDDSLRFSHSHVTLAYIEKSQTILNSAQIATTTTLTNETLTTTLSGGGNNASNSAQNHNLSAKALSMGCISQINYAYQIKSIKQKQLINGVLFSLQEIYGIEKKCSDESEVDHVTNDEEEIEPEEINDIGSGKTESYAKKSLDVSNQCISIETTNVSNDTITTTSSTSTHVHMAENINRNNDKEQELKGIECVICMCESRDTLILPCRHLCLCKLCAINLRVQSNNCPICRIPFIALIQIKLFKKRELISNRKEEHDPNLNMNQLPRVKLQSLNNELYDQDDNCGSAIEKVVADKLENSVIIHIGNRLVSNQGEMANNKEVLTKCENASRRVVAEIKKLSDFYECVTIYDAFNYKDNDSGRSGSSSKGMSNTTDVMYRKLELHSHGGKKKRSKTSKNGNQSNPQSSSENSNESNRIHDAQFTHIKIEREQYLDTTATNRHQNEKLDLAKLDSKNFNSNCNETRSKSVIIEAYPNTGTNSNIIENSLKPNVSSRVNRKVNDSTCGSHLPFNTNNYVSKSYVDIRRTPEEISLEKFNENKEISQLNKQQSVTNKINCSRF